MINTISRSRRPPEGVVGQIHQPNIQDRINHGLVYRILISAQSRHRGATVFTK